MSTQQEIDRDICGLCGGAGADKTPHPGRWPGEQSPGTTYVHATCEAAEYRRARDILLNRQRRVFLNKLATDAKGGR